MKEMCEQWDGMSGLTDEINGRCERWDGAKV